MLKSTFNKFNLKSDEVLSLEQQRKIRGGFMSAFADCGPGLDDVTCSGGVQCRATDLNGCSCYDSAGEVVSSASCLSKLSPIAPDLG